MYSIQISGSLRERFSGLSPVPVRRDGRDGSTASGSLRYHRFNSSDREEHRTVAAGQQSSAENAVHNAVEMRIDQPSSKD